MKKLICALLCAAMLLSLCAYGEGADAPSAKGLTIGGIVVTLGDATVDMGDVTVNMLGSMDEQGSFEAQFDIRDGEETYVPFQVRGGADWADMVFQGMNKYIHIDSAAPYGDAQVENVLAAYITYLKDMRDPEKVKEYSARWSEIVIGAMTHTGTVTVSADGQEIPCEAYEAEFDTASFSALADRIIELDPSLKIFADYYFTRMGGMMGSLTGEDVSIAGFADLLALMDGQLDMNMTLLIGEDGQYMTSSGSAAFSLANPGSDESERIQFNMDIDATVHGENVTENVRLTGGNEAHSVDMTFSLSGSLSGGAEMRMDMRMASADSEASGQRRAKAKAAETNVAMGFTASAMPEGASEAHLIIEATDGSSNPVRIALDTDENQGAGTFALSCAGLGGDFGLSFDYAVADGEIAEDMFEGLEAMDMYDEDGAMDMSAIMNQMTGFVTEQSIKLSKNEHFIALSQAITNLSVEDDEDYTVVNYEEFDTVEEAAQYLGRPIPAPQKLPEGYELAYVDCYNTEDMSISLIYEYEGNDVFIVNMRLSEEYSSKLNTYMLNEDGEWTLKSEPTIGIKISGDDGHIYYADLYGTQIPNCTLGLFNDCLLTEEDIITILGSMG